VKRSKVYGSRTCLLYNVVCSGATCRRVVGIQFLIVPTSSQLEGTGHSHTGYSWDKNKRERETVVAVAGREGLVSVNSICLCLVRGSTVCVSEWKAPSSSFCLHPLHPLYLSVIYHQPVPAFLVLPLLLRFILHPASDSSCFSFSCQCQLVNSSSLIFAHTAPILHSFVLVLVLASLQVSSHSVLPLLQPFHHSWQFHLNGG
jgi:hypothetical protein